MRIRLVKWAAIHKSLCQIGYVCPLRCLTLLFLLCWVSATGKKGLLLINHQKGRIIPDSCIGRIKVIVDALWWITTLWLLFSSGLPWWQKVLSYLINYSGTEATEILKNCFWFFVALGIQRPAFSLRISFSYPWLLVSMFPVIFSRTFLYKSTG